MIQQVMKNPASFTAPAENNAVNSVNDNFSGLAKSLRSQFLQTGGGQSGKYGTALASGDISRLSNISGVQNQFANTNAMLPLNVASSLAMPLLGMNFGSTTSGSSSGGTNTDQSQQTQQTTSNGGTGGAISSGIGSILSSLAPLLMFA